MDNENSTALNEAQSGEQTEVVAPQETEETPTDAAGQERVVDAQDAADAENGEEGAAQPEEQSREENAAIRAARLRARREGEEQGRRAAEERFQKAGVVNPMTGKPFADLEEWETYAAKLDEQQIAQRAKKSGRTVEEVSEEVENQRFITEMRRNAQKKKKEEANAEKQRNFVENDLADFLEKYPDFTAEKLAGLEKNKDFRVFCGSRFGHEPLATLYRDFCSLIGDAGRAAVSRATGKSERSTGSGTAGGAVLSPEQKRELDTWNAEHPEMKMSAKEFLGRG